MLVPSYLVTGNNEKDVDGWIQIVGAHNIPLSRKLSKEMLLKYARQEIAAGRNTSEWQEIKKYCEAMDLSDVSPAEVNKFYQMGGDAEQLISDVQNIPNDQKETNGSHAELHDVGKSDFTPGVFQAMLPELVKTSQGEAIKKLTIPVLVLYGRYDFLVPPGLADEVINHVKSTLKKKVEFPKAGHGLLEENPDKAHREMIEFIDQVLAK